MKKYLKHKLYMGFRGVLMRIPPLLSDKGARKGEKGARANAASLSNVERSVHHFIVKKMAVVKVPITAELIAAEADAVSSARGLWGEHRQAALAWRGPTPK